MAEELQENSLRNDIVNAMAEVKETPEVVSEPVEQEEVEIKTVDGRDEKGRFKSKETPIEKVVDVTEAKPVVEEAPHSLSAAAKAKWADLPPEIKAEWSKRETDVHKMMTRSDGELQMGREMKEILTPYMAIIQADGGTPASAVRSLLDTAYQLRTATPAKKAQLVQAVIRDYGVDMSLVQQQEYQDPTIQALQQEIANLKQIANPENLYKTFEEKSENNRILTEVKAFASDPANKFYEQVKPLMASLLGSGTVQNMKEAYDAACKAHPAVSSILEAEKNSSLQVKQAAEIAAKRKAAASITGSPGATVPNSGSPNRSLAEELRANYRALTS